MSIFSLYNLCNYYMDYINIDTAYELPETPALGIRKRPKVDINLNDTHYEATTEMAHNGMVHNVMAIAPMEMFEPKIEPKIEPEMEPVPLHKMGMVTTFYLGSISVVGLYIFYRILNK